MDGFSYYSDILDDQPIFEVEWQTYEKNIAPFMQFQARIQSLQRYWELIHKATNSHLEEMKTVPQKILNEFKKGKEQYFAEKRNGTKLKNEEVHMYEQDFCEDELTAFYYEYFAPDNDLFPDFLKGVVVTYAISLLDIFLQNLNQQIAIDTKSETKHPEKGNSLIEKHLNSFAKNYGLNIDVDNGRLNSLKSIRLFRNKFIHDMDESILTEVQKSIAQIMGYTHDASYTTDKFITHCLFEICSLIKTIELSYLKHLDRLNKS